MTFIQLAITHLLVLGFASLTRGLRGLFQAVGLGAVVAPSQAYMRGSRATRYRGGTKYKPIWQNVSNWFVHGSGGIAGGGLFEFQWTTAKHVLPVAVVLVAKVVLSNLSFAYAILHHMFPLAPDSILISSSDTPSCPCTCSRGSPSSRSRFSSPPSSVAPATL